ncbi:MAG: hypothetical protein GC147_08110 [Porphyrobacter sp.]|nr:hypothetical protein [Porphyrobacter sp.]
MVRIWADERPSTFVPLWHETQVPLAEAWLKVAGVQPVVRWQSSQVFVVLRWFADFPVAVVPLWHEAQFPVTPA